MARRDSAVRAKILEAAVREFAAHGPRGATTRRVAAAAGVNSGLLYYYFDDKPALYLECLRLVVGGFMDRLRARPRAFRGARERLAFLVDAILDYYSRHGARMRLLMAALDLRPDLFAQVLNEFLQNEPLPPMEILADGIRRGELRAIPPVHAWWSVLGLCMFSLATQRVVTRIETPWLRPGQASPADRRRYIVELLMRGLAAPARTTAMGRRDKAMGRERKP